MIERKIIDVDSSAPLISKKKKRQSLIALGIILGIIAIIVFSIIFKTEKKIQQVSGYTIATVIKGDFTSFTEASGSVVLPTQVSIVAMDEGYAKTLNVTVGDSVTVETTLAELSVPELEQNKVDLENSIESQQISLEQIILSNSFAVEELKLRIERKKKEITEAKEEVERAKSLMELKSSREADYNTILDTLEDLENQLEDLELSIEKEKKQGALSKKAQETQIRQLNLNLERVIDDIKASKIKSPISGDVLFIDEKLSVPGSLIEQNVQLFTIANTSDVYIDLEVYEQYRTILSLEDTMEILVSSNFIEAEIIQIGSVASLSSDSLAATIQVRVKPIGDVELTLGASAVANIPLGTKNNALTLPRGAYLTTGNQQYIYVVKDNTAIKTKITYGAMDGNQVEILSGVKEGDKVIVSSYQNFIDQDQIELKE